MVALLVLPVSARVPDNIVDYNDLVSRVEVDGNNDLVTLDVPVSNFWLGAWYNSQWISKRVGSYIDYRFSQPATIIAFPLGYSDYIQLDATNIPSGTTINFAIDITTTSGRSFKNMTVIVYYFDAEGNFIETQTLGSYPGVIGQTIVAPSESLEIPSNASTFYFRVEFCGVSESTSGERFMVSFSHFDVCMSISSLYRQQQLTGKTNELLKAVEKQLAEQGKTMDDILNQQQQTNDKLNELPGEIGNEMQGIIDNEKTEAKDEGNKFVDQILDALPDPSAEVLGALKSLTDSTSYTGTDAVLPIPAIVLPGIAGLFPETEIWAGTDFDFGEYVQLLPPALLTLVQALFTIAIVIFCVYELKGIISYCLTLRENKGG